MARYEFTVSIEDHGGDYGVHVAGRSMNHGFSLATDECATPEDAVRELAAYLADDPSSVVVRPINE